MSQPVPQDPDAFPIHLPYKLFKKAILAQEDGHQTFATAAMTEEERTEIVQYTVLQKLAEGVFDDMADSGLENFRVGHKDFISDGINADATYDDWDGRDVVTAPGYLQEIDDKLAIEGHRPDNDYWAVAFGELEDFLEDSDDNGYDCQ